MTKEEVIHANLTVLEQRLRNAFNCGYEYAKNEMKEEIERELRMKTAQIRSVTDEELRLVQENAYFRGWNDGLHGRCPIVPIEEETPSE